MQVALGEGRAGGAEEGHSVGCGTEVDGRSRACVLSRWCLDRAVTN